MAMVSLLFPFEMRFGLRPSNRSAETFRSSLDAPLTPALKSQYGSEPRRVFLHIKLAPELSSYRILGPIKIKLLGR